MAGDYDIPIAGPINATRAFCAVDDAPPAVGGSPVRLQNVAVSGVKLRSRRLTWKCSSAWPAASLAALDAMMTTATAAWHLACPSLTFEHTPGAGDGDVHLLLDHALIDGGGFALANANYPDGGQSVITMDAADSPTPAKQAKVLLHELGHVIGIGHSADVTSIMWPNTGGTAVSIDPMTTLIARTLYGWEDPVDLGGDAAGPPGLATDGSTLLAVFRGFRDQNLQERDGVGSALGIPRRMAGKGSSSSPALTFADGAWHAAWKGINDDTRIFLSSRRQGASTWAEQQLMGWQTTQGPALTGVPGALITAWGHPDGHLEWAYRGVLGGITSGLNGGWSSPRAVPGGLTDAVPALVQAGGAVHLFWKGGQGDVRVWHSHLDQESQTWATPAVIQTIVDIKNGKPPERADLTTITAVRACALPTGELALAVDGNPCSITICAQATSGVFEWSTPMPTPFDSIFGQSIAVVDGTLVAVGQPSPDRLRGGMMLARLPLR